LLDLEFGACRLVVAAREGSGVASLDDVHGAPRVATVFPRLTRRFFESAGREVTLVPVSGAAEIAPHLGIADIVVDLVSTGSTMRVNSLREIGTIMESSARLIAAAGPDGSIPAPLQELSDALESVIRARGKRYVMANVPRATLDRVRAVLPGLNGPTVIDLLNGGTHVAVHAVVPQCAIYRTISNLRALGAEGVLVTRIERLMP
jgi:ATP phosphoribosyltransferase